MNEDNESVGLDQGISDLYIILNDEFEGLIKRLLDTDFNEKHSDKDFVTALECMEDEVSRVWRLVEWHDKLAEIGDGTWKFIESDDPNDLELRFKTTDWLVRLKERIGVELMLRQLKDEEIKGKSFENKDKRLLLGFSDYLLESIPSVDFLNEDNEGRLELINDFLVEWWKKDE